MWELSQPWWEFIARGAIIYGFVFLMVRLLGKRSIGQLTPFDFVLLLIISNAVQNSMNAGDNSITAGLVLAATLVTINIVIGHLIFRSKKFEKLIDGSPVVLIHHGKILSKVMQREEITQQDLDTALHKEGIWDASEVRYAILEPNGQISVMKKN